MLLLHFKLHYFLKFVYPFFSPVPKIVLTESVSHPVPNTEQFHSTGDKIARYCHDGGNEAP